MTAERCFIDSNIWLYSFTAREDETDKRLTARTLLSAVDPTISTQVINEVCANLIRKFGYSEAEVVHTLNSLYRRCYVKTLTRPVFTGASRLRQAYPLSYWDSVIIATALQAGATTLYTEDMQDGLLVFDQLHIINPFKTELKP